MTHPPLPDVFADLGPCPDGWKDVTFVVTVRTYDDVRPARLREGLAYALSGIAAENLITEADARVVACDLATPPAAASGPTPCTSCGTSMESCDEQVITRGSGCCPACRQRDTHNNPFDAEAPRMAAARRRLARARGER